MKPCVLNVSLLLMLIVPTVLVECFETCDKISACSCDSEDGIIDLSPLDSKDPNNPAFHDEPGGAYVYSYNPCTSFTETQTCVNSAVCQIQPGLVPGYGYELGVHSNAEFIVDPNTKALQIKMQDPNMYYTSIITLVCDPNTYALFEPPLLATPPTYLFTLTSKYACPSTKEGGGGGLSTGSILCIVLLVLVIVYIIAGTAYMNVVKGAKGVEVIPNFEFWKELPSLIKDGIMFAISGFKSKVGYEQI